MEGYSVVFIGIEPGVWMPPIILASKDVDVSALVCIMCQLGEPELNWKIQMENFAIVGQEGCQGGYIHSKYPF